MFFLEVVLYHHAANFTDETMPIVDWAVYSINLSPKYLIKRRIKFSGAIKS